MHVVQLVIKNASELDYTLPVFWGLTRQTPDVRISVVHCTIDRRQILRSGAVFDDVLHDLGVEQLDLADAIHIGRRSPLRWVAKRLFAKPSADEHSVRDNLRALRAGGLSRADSLDALVRAVLGLRDRVMRRAQRAFLRAATVGELLSRLDPDVVLLGNRSLTQFPGRKEVFELLYSGIPVVLVPHAAHETIRDEFTPFDEEGEALPPMADYWTILQDVETAQRFPDQAANFTAIGYPGLDPEWCDWLRSRAGSAPGDALRAVVIGRKFVAPGAPRPDDPFTLSYDEMRDHLRVIDHAAAELDTPVEVVLKPHPSTNRFLLEQLMAETCPTWRTTFDPVAALAAEADVVLGIFSTALVIPVSFGCPVVVADSRVQRFVDDRWPLMADMYHGFEFFVRRDSELQAAFRVAADRAPARRSGALARPTADEEHIARFFIPGALGRSVARVVELAARK